MKKTIRGPIVLGSILGALSFFSSAVHWIVPIGHYGAIGPHEIFAILSAALGGPLGLFVESILHTIGAHIYLMNFSPEMASLALLISIGEFVARTFALLVVAFCYKFLYQRTKKALPFLGGWILIVGIYYSLLLPLQALDWAIFLPNVLPLSTLIQGAPPEFLTVALVTTLIWIALPVRSRRPQWYG